jgi:N-acyl-D-amino-acid deacylase
MDLLVRNGSVIDGTGSAPRRADVRVSGRRIVEVGPSLTRGDEVVLDAHGMFVTPGFIENHTHLDAALFWDETLDPLPQHGVTTALMGNCSLSLVPLRAIDRARIVAAFAFIEDIPEEVILKAPPWDWESYDEYVASVRRRSLSLNLGQLIGHSALRTFVMGEAAWERSATDLEISEMGKALDSCLRRGAVGLSTSFFDTDMDANPVPSRFATGEELVMMIEVLRRHGRTLQFVADANSADPMADVERMARLTAGKITTTFTGVINRMPSRAIEVLDRCAALQAEGVATFAQVSPRPLDVRLNWDSSLWMSTMQNSWALAIKARGDNKRRLLLDESWRAAARRDWDVTLPPLSPLRLTDRIRLVEVTRPEHEPWIGRSLLDLATDHETHVSDALADWVLNNDLNPGVVVMGVSNGDPEMVARNVQHPAGIIGNSDAGAHMRMFSGAGDSTLLLARHVRDRNDLSIEAAIHALTGRQAQLFGLPRRGTIEVGSHADLVVFDLDEVSWDPADFVWDVPGGTHRYRRPPGGFHWTIVRGEIVQCDGELTAARPGALLT